MDTPVHYYKGEDALNRPRVYNYYIAPNNGSEIQTMFQGTEGIHLLTEHNVTYMLFPLLENRNRKQALRVLSLVIDLIVQQFPCGPHMADDYKKEALWGDMPRFIIMALVKVNTDYTGYQKGSFLSERFFDAEVPVCPIAFLLCKNRSAGNGVNVVYSHLDIVCAQPAPRADKVGPTFSTGHILLYYMLDYALNTLHQDVELTALDDTPMLIKFYASHGFILCDQNGGCRQLTPKVIATFDEAMTPLYDPLLNWVIATREELLNKIGLSKQQVIVMTDNDVDKVGWYMLFCSNQAARLGMSKKKADELLARHDRDKINLASSKIFKGSIKFGKRDDIFAQFQIKYNMKL